MAVKKKTTHKKTIEIVRLQLILTTLSNFSNDRNDNVRRAVVDLIEKIYNDLNA